MQNLKSPMSGLVMDLSKVPDPVFSSKMVGDGFSIDPVSQVLLAPISGKIASLHTSAHAVSIQSDSGFEILMHIGLETVQLKGEGFEAKVRIGDSVKEGDELIAFDADLVGSKAKSLLTQVVVTNMDDVSNLRLIKEGFCQSGDEVCAFELREKKFTDESSSQKVAESAPIEIVNKSGLHARPAATLVNIVKKYSSKVTIYNGEKSANARSLVGIMGIEISYKDRVTLHAEGEDANEVIIELEQAIKEGLGESPGHEEKVPTAIPKKTQRNDPPNIIRGVGASVGLAYGRVAHITNRELTVEEKGNDPSSEKQALLEALKDAEHEIEILRAKLEEKGSKDKAAIFTAHIELLGDPDLITKTNERILAGSSAAFAWQTTYKEMATHLDSLKNELLAARANDINDVGMRVLRLLADVAQESWDIPENSILIANDLTPSDTINIDKNRVLGFCTVTGGATSHVAILARSLGIPAIAGIDSQALDIEQGTLVILDGSEGILDTKPSTESIKNAEEFIKKDQQQHATDLKNTHEKAVTSDGSHVLVFANIGSVADAEEAVELGAEGVGLLRSEFLFMNRDKGPGISEQQNIYNQMTNALGKDRPLVVRTLDVGGDKPLNYLSFPKEENPFLGLRGIRVGLDQPGVLREQLKAILEASKSGSFAIMFPMIGFIDEFREAKAILEEERIRLGVDPIKVGMMIEVPSAALCASVFAEEVDFFSIGSNDLTQYTLAIDRGHSKLAPKIDALHPAVLKLIDNTTKAAQKYQKMVAVCGGLAGDPMGIPILIGLGVEELSVSCPMIPRVKADIRKYSKAECEELAAKALLQETARDVRNLCKEFMDHQTAAN